MFPDYSFQSNYLSVEGGRLHYIDEGEGPVIVMVHGNPTWSYYFRHCIEELAKTHRVIALDHIGCGLSDKPQHYPYRLEQHIANLESLLAELEIERYSLMVHDWGGSIGMGCAVRAPEKVEKIVVLNTAAFRSTRIPFRIRICRWPLLGPLLVRGLNGFAWPATFMAVTRPLEKDVAQAYLAPYNNWHNRVAIHAFVKDIPMSPKHISYSTLVSIEDGLKRLLQEKIPMMIIWGGRDFCFTKHFYYEWCTRFPGATTHYFPDGGHYILEDKREEIQLLLQQFFS